jgi:pantetheine-phosphate adenylyltransferase
MAAKRLAICPGAFDPPTLGHLDIIRRGLAVFDEVVVAVAHNPGKDALFSVQERLLLLGESTAGMAHVTIDSYDGLTIDYARQLGACAILRGIRTPADFDYESHLALTNRALSGIETVFVLASPQFSFISSSLIREVARLGGDVSSLVPASVLKALRQRFSGLKET